jgi:hypothetical protein
MIISTTVYSRVADTNSMVFNRYCAHYSINKAHKIGYIRVEYWLTLQNKRIKMNCYSSSRRQVTKLEVDLTLKAVTAFCIKSFNERKTTIRV